MGRAPCTWASCTGPGEAGGLGQRKNTKASCLLGPRVQSWTGRAGKGSPSSGAGFGLGWVGREEPKAGSPGAHPTTHPPPSRAHSPSYVQTQLATGSCERGDRKLRKPASALMQGPGSKEHSVLGQEARGERLEGPRGRVLCAQAGHRRHTGLVVTRLQGEDEERRWLQDRKSVV